MDKVHISHEFYSQYVNTCGVWELINDGIAIRRTFVDVFSGMTTEEAMYKARQWAKSRRDEFERTQGE